MARRRFPRPSTEPQLQPSHHRLDHDELARRASLAATAQLGLLVIHPESPQCHTSVAYFSIVNLFGFRKSASAYELYACSVSLTAGTLAIDRKHLTKIGRA